MTKRQRVTKLNQRPGFEIVGPADDDAIQCLEIVIGGQNVKVYKMNVGSLQALVKLTEPYIKRAVTALVSQVGLERIGDKDTMSKALRTVIGEQLSEMVVAVPETLVKACACIMNIRPSDDETLDWFVSSVLPSEVLDVLPQLDELNNFGVLWEQALGLWGHFDKKYELSTGLQRQIESRTKD